MLALAVAVLVGVAVSVSVGEAVGATHRVVAAPLLRGLGAPVEKSVALSPASLQPDPARRTAVVLLAAGAGPVPS